ncbi:MAG: 4Fe-4S dicluster domain-containing protein [Candidatus Marinimicrobia bacterium]|nr:4Fe-4S dicluster domain-containing protein [Candidatus Neomarinimicrobiota bacterium]MBL7046350.1 4Fe-4S dicluster domain-containing protein [Candidatus Neomarinimicrobiota bacterium]
MSSATTATIKSDPTLMSEIRKYGEFNTNACLQCGSCTVICDLSTGSTSFPRRTIQYVLMGLRKLLNSSLEPWLCYYCGDCSTICPREVKPGEAMMIFWRYSITDNKGDQLCNPNQ